MTKLQAVFYLFLILLVTVFLFDYVLIKKKYLKTLNSKKKGKKKNKNNELTEIAYLVGKFKLDKSKLNLNNLLLGISFINAFIIALVASVVLFLNISIVFQLAIGFVLIIALIYSLYELLGRYLVKKGSK